MPDALTIDFAVTNFSRVEKSFKSAAKLSADAQKQVAALEKGLEAAAAAFDKLTEKIGRFNSRSGGSGGGGRAAQSVFGPGRAVSSRSYASGPFQRQEALAGQLKSALDTGNRRAAVDVRLAQIRNDNQIKKLVAPEKGFGGKFGDLLHETQFGGKGGLLSLASRATGLAAEALGPEVLALAGPVGLVVGGLTAAATAVWNLAKGAAEAGAAFSAFQVAVGTNGRDASKAQSIGLQAGLSSDATASQVNSLESAITTDPMARARALRYGVFNIGGYYGNQNHAQDYNKIIEGMRANKSMSYDDKVRDLKLFGIEGSAGALQTSDKQFAYGKQDAGVHDQIFDQDFATKSADFQDALGRVGSAFTNLEAALGKNLIADVTNFLNGFANGINALATVINSPMGQAALKVMSAIPRAAIAASPVGVAVNALSSASSEDDAHTQALKDNTAATKELTQRIPGVYGKDTDGRLGRALPGAAGYGALNMSRSAYVQGAIRLGAF